MKAVVTIKETIISRKGITLQAGSTWAGHIAWGQYFKTWTPDNKGVLHPVWIEVKDERIEFTNANDTEIK